MGLDVGTKTIGLALSDTRCIIATPLDTIRRRRFRDDMARLFALIDTHRAGGLVVGLPLTLAGGDGPRTQSVRQFARNLWPCAICRWHSGTSGCLPQPLSAR